VSRDIEKGLKGERKRGQGMRNMRESRGFSVYRFEKKNN
jgi:hypothetical protein